MNPLHVPLVMLPSPTVSDPPPVSAQPVAVRLYADLGVGELDGRHGSHLGSREDLPRLAEHHARRLDDVVEVLTADVDVDDQS